LEIIHNFVVLYSKKSSNSIAVYDIQLLKESAGLERAYVYNQLLSDKFNDVNTQKIKQLILNQKIFKDNFLADSTPEFITLYNKLVDKNILEKIEKFRSHFFNNKLGSKNAKEWFELSSKLINQYESLSSQIINIYLSNIKQTYDDAQRALFVTALALLLSIASILVLMFILNALVKNEEKNAANLKIAAYTFNSHEAMVITDVEGIIIRVNRAFTEVTGYEADEVIGKNPRLLKSQHHSKEFFENMWNRLLTDGKWSGEIYNKRKNGEVYLERLSITAIKDESGATTHYIAQFLDITDMKKAQDEAIYQSYHDFLTKLPNKKFMIQKLKEEFARAKRHNFLHAFLFIDLDGFKRVNDNCGHDVGDKLLEEVAKRIRNTIREDDFVARISGDEFAIMLLDLDKIEREVAKDIKVVCSKIIEEISKPFYLDGHKIQIGVSIGIKLFPDNKDGINDTVKHADIAMYRAKAAGKNRFVFFDDLSSYIAK
jgi:diguanylate cyclase (GGDEF)-like protein/PAS domain S-box-containing protein